MKLYGSTTSPYVRRIRLFLSGKDYEFINMDIFGFVNLLVHVAVLINIAFVLPVLPSLPKLPMFPIPP